MKFVGWLTISLALLLISLYSGQVSAQTETLQYCVDITQSCYDSLPKAEAAVRSASNFQDQIRRVSEERVGTSPTGFPLIKYTYKVPNVEPEILYPPAYDATSSDTTCAPAGPPYGSGYCANPDEGLINWYNFWVDQYATYCPDGYLEPMVLSGAHEEPFSQTAFDGSGVSREGIIYFSHWYFNGVSFPERVRQVNFKGQCSPSSPINDYHFEEAKRQKFLCPDKFHALPAMSPAAGAPLFVAEYPFFCSPMLSAYGEPEKFTISGTIKQVDSCPANPNPCHPTTGDKSRTESDLAFSGADFTRHYHSLGEISNAGFGVGWTHSYSDAIGRSGSDFYYISESGNYERVLLVSGNVFRLEKSINTTIETIATGSVAYRLKRPDGSIRDFDSTGKLTALRIQSNGASDKTVSYNGEKIDKITDASGRALQFEYSGTLISKLLYPDGMVVTYDYDEHRNLIEVDYGGGSVRNYHYAEMDLADPTYVNLLTGITAENGTRYASFGYDSKARVVSSALHSPSGNVATTTVFYDSDSQARVELSSGQVRTYSIQPGLYRKILNISDSAGSVANTYDTLGRLTSTTDPRGVITKYEYPSQIVRIVVDAFGTSAQRRIETDLTATNLPAERRTLNAAGALVTKTNWTYNTRGQVLTTTQTDPVSGASRTTTNTWCEQTNVDAGTCPVVGLLVSVNGPRTDVPDVTSYTYYASDDAICATAPAICPHRRGDLWKVTNALSQTTETQTYDGAGRPLSVKDADGIVTEMTYHPRGWLTSHTIKGPTAATDRSVLIDYWPTGLVKKVTHADGSFTAYTYDAAHRLTDIADSAGNTLHYTLDNAGNRTGEDTRDPNGVLTRTLSRLYNQLGQLYSQSDAYQHATGYDYDGNGNTTGVGDALGRGTGNTYDPLNRLSSTIQDTTGIAAATQFQYDALDNLTKVIDPKGLATNYTYSGLGDLKQLASPDTGTTNYTYDSGGNRKTQTDARGVTATYNYDAVNRLIGITYPTASLNAGYQYDMVNGVCGAGETFAKGHLTQITDSSGSTQYCYTRFGELARKVQVTNGKTFVTRYGYDNAGRLSNLIYPDGTLADYVRDGDGRVAELGITSPGSARKVVLTGATYAPFGPSTGWTYGNGRTFVRNLNLNYQPQVIQDGSTGGLSLSFGFDAVGNLTLLQNAGQTTNLAQYGYDGLNRLQQTKDGQTGTPIEIYAYDDTGNRTSVTRAGVKTAYTYANNSHRLTKIGKTARSYSNSGSLLSNGTLTFSYEDSGRLYQVKSGQTVVSTNYYNGKGEQVRRHMGPNSTYFLYDEVGHLLGEYDNAGAPVQQVVWLDDLPVGVLAGSSQTLHYIEPDHLGAPRVVIDGISNVAIWKWDLQGEAFGATPPNQNPDGDANQFVFNLRYPGQRYDSATGFNYNYFRDYDPSTGRYVESDPIGFRGGVGSYVYVLNDPLQSDDIYGLDGKRKTRYNAWNEYESHRKGDGSTMDEKVADYRRAQLNGMTRRPGPREELDNLTPYGNRICQEVYCFYREQEGTCRPYDGWYLQTYMPPQPTVAQVNRMPRCECRHWVPAESISLPEADGMDSMELAARLLRYRNQTRTGGR